MVGTVFPGIRPKLGDGYDEVKIADVNNVDAIISHLLEYPDRATDGDVLKVKQELAEKKLAVVESVQSKELPWSALTAFCRMEKAVDEMIKDRGLDLGDNSRLR